MCRVREERKLLCVGVDLPIDAGTCGRTPAGDRTLATSALPCSSTRRPSRGEMGLMAGRLLAAGHVALDQPVRTVIDISLSTSSRCQFVVPFPVKIVRLQGDGLHL